MFKEIMAEVAATRRGRYLQNHTTINPWGRGYITNNLLIWPDTRARMMTRRMMSSFFSSPFVTPTTTKETDDAKAPTKDGLDSRANGLFDTLVTTEGGGGSSSSSSSILIYVTQQSTNFYRSNRQISKNKPDYKNQSNFIH